MIINNNVNPSTDKINAKVELYNGSTLVATCTCNDRLQDFKVERIGQGSKFFGFGIVHKININLIDLERNLEVTKENSFKVSYIANNEEVKPYPTFYAAEINRDETTNTISVVAYDKLYNANKYTLNDLALGDSYSIRDIANAGAAVIGVTSVSIPSNISAFNADYPTGANFSEERTENLSSIMNSAAEATQTIYYLNNHDVLTFKRLNKGGTADLVINKDDYYQLQSGENFKLTTIMHVTELGDNVHSSTGEEGATQYIRNNPFYEVLSSSEVGEALDAAIAAVGGTTVNQFVCDWDGNILLEIGDCIAIVTEDDNRIYSYLLDDTVEFTGTLSETTQWTYDPTSESASNPSTLKEVLNQTSARVDKANKQIKLVAGEVSDVRSSVAQIELDLDGIDLSITQITTTTNTLQETTEAQAEEIEAQSKEIDALKTSSDEQAATITTHTEQIGALEISTSNITAKVSSLETKTDGLDSTVTSQTERIGALEISTNTISASVSNIETRTGALETTAEGLTSTVDSHSKKIGELEVSTGGISAKVTNLETKTETIDAAIESQGEQIGALESETDTLASTTQSQGEQIGALESATSVLTTTVTTHTEQIGALEVDTRSISASVSNLQTTTTNSIDELNATTSAHTEQIGALQINTDSISASVTSLEQKTINSVDGLQESIESLSREVSLKMTEDAVQIAIESELSKGVDKVSTSTGFTFNDEGLRISKDNSGIENLIDNTGMYVRQDGTEVLSANTEGVTAKDLHAVTYLWIGSHSRIEDYEGNRTGCFYIGR